MSSTVSSTACVIGAGGRARKILHSQLSGCAGSASRNFLIIKIRKFFSRKKKGLYLQHDYLIFRIKIFPRKSLSSSSRDMRSMLKIQAKTCMLLCDCNMFLQSTECRLLNTSILFQGRGFAVSELLSLSFPV